MNNRTIIACLVFLAAALATAPPAFGGEDSEELITKTFKIEYKEFQDAVLIVTDIVQREGSERNDVRLQHRLKRITVTDIRRVVDAVAAALEAFDVPPRQVVVRMTLFLGSREKPEPVEDVFNSVVGELRKALHYTSYQVLGSLDVPVVEGERTSVTVGGGYTIQFVVGRVDGPRQLVQLSPLVLSRGVQAEGQGGAEQILTTTLNLKSGQQMVMGASSDPSADRALLLAIVADIVG
jgi:hypothetical protein